jgi:energy-coupling factor transporter ATP-binding protein EcfA2
MGSPRLRSLQIHKYRHVVPGTSLEFGAGFNVLLGRNGTGKTTLLELIEMIWAKGFGKIADEPFHLEYTVEFDDLDPPPSPEMIAEMAKPGCLIRVVVENAAVETARHDSKHSRSAGPPLNFRYEITMTDLDGEPMLAVKGTPYGASMYAEGNTISVRVLSANSAPIVWSAPMQYLGADVFDAPSEFATDKVVTYWAARCNLIVDDIENLGRFDESLGAFHALTSDVYRFHDRGMAGSYWAITRTRFAELLPLEISQGSSAFFPPDLIAHWILRLRKDPHLDPPEFQDSLRDAGLAVFLSLTDYADVIIRSGPPTRDRDSVTEHLKFGAPEFRIILQNNRGEIPAQALSYGEKRLLSFLWHLACNPSVIIADELVNGFHHEWIERCVELIGERQAFLASQNPLLLDCLPLESEADVLGCFITCRRNADGQMSWTNLSAEEAADFYRSYERQTRYTHEILRSKGLW